MLEMPGSHVATEEDHRPAVVGVGLDRRETVGLVQANGDAAFSEHVENDPAIAEDVDAGSGSIDELARDVLPLELLDDVHALESGRAVVMADEEHLTDHVLVVRRRQEHLAAWGHASPGNDVRSAWKAGGSTAGAPRGQASGSRR